MQCIHIQILKTCRKASPTPHLVKCPIALLHRFCDLLREGLHMSLYLRSFHRLPGLSLHPVLFFSSLNLPLPDVILHALFSFSISVSLSGGESLKATCLFCLPLYSWGLNRAGHGAGVNSHLLKGLNVERTSGNSTDNQLKTVTSVITFIT